ncbi:unnamed protein product, partial [marine sediment metagenome]
MFALDRDYAGRAGVVKELELKVCLAEIFPALDDCKVETHIATDDPKPPLFLGVPVDELPKGQHVIEKCQSSFSRL